MVWKRNQKWSIRRESVVCLTIERFRFVSYFISLNSGMRTAKMHDDDDLFHRNVATNHSFACRLHFDCHSLWWTRAGTCGIFVFCFSVYVTIIAKLGKNWPLLWHARSMSYYYCRQFSRTNEYRRRWRRQWWQWRWQWPTITQNKNKLPGKPQHITECSEFSSILFCLQNVAMCGCVARSKSFKSRHN